MGGAGARAFLYNTSDCESGKETLCIHSFHNVVARSIARAIACGALLYQPYCKCPKFGPKIGRARNWPSRRPAALYECSFEQWARIFGRVIIRPTRPVPPGLYLLQAYNGSRQGYCHFAISLNAPRVLHFSAFHLFIRPLQIA